MGSTTDVTDVAGRSSSGPQRPVAPGDPAPVGPFTELSARRLGPIRRFFLRRPVAMDIVVVLWFGVPGLVQVIVEMPGRHLGVMVGCTLAGATALVWRRRAPLLVLALMVALGVVQAAAGGTINNFDLGIALAVYAVAASRPARTAWLAAVAACVATGIAVMFWEQPVSTGGTASVWTGSGATVTSSSSGGAPIDQVSSVQSLRIASVTSVVLLALAAISIGISVHNRRAHVRDLVDRANQIARERDQQAQLATAAERARISREMHDVVAHSLTVMIALADGAAVALQRDPVRAETALHEVSATGRTALADMRRVLGVLNDDTAPMGPQPGGHDLEELIEGFRTAGLPVQVITSGGALPADVGLQLAVFRIVQESLTNTLRYAPGAGHVEVRISRPGGNVDVEIIDDGGIGQRQVSVGSGRGVIGMRERTAVYGGSVDAGPYRGGWRVHATLIWQET